MKLSEIKGQEAIDVLADIMMPAAEIMRDKRVVDLIRKGETLKAIHVMLKNHSKSVIEMLAYLEKEDPATYEPSVVTLPLKLLELFNDPMVKELFFTPEQTKDATSSSPVTESTEESRK